MLSFIASCGHESYDVNLEEGGSAAASSSIEVWWQGQLIEAEVRGNHIFVEGDIRIGLAPPNLRPGQSPVIVQRAGARWPNGVVPYNFAVDVDDDARAIVPTLRRNDVRDAIRDWERLVPGLRFIDRTDEADYVSIYISDGCFSDSIGRRGGQQFIGVTNGCIDSFSMHHELAHAVGAFHEHTRKDRADWVQVNWGNIRGCPTAANGSEDCGCDAGDCGCPADGEGCNLSGNFVSNATRSDVLAYDYESIMHYRTNTFTNGAGNTITTLQPLGGASVGQRLAFSDLDGAKMRVGYPVAELNTFVFSGTGEQKICRLAGRDLDTANEYEIAGWPASVDGERVQTNELGSTTATVTCTVESVFFAENYDYPNTSFDPAFDNYASDSIERYSVTVDIVVQPIAIVAAIL
ncbi:MAG: M12 family metallopeptidase [Myxococcota bacterium]